jgi:hypothetical protein
MLRFWTLFQSKNDDLTESKAIYAEINYQGIDFQENANFSAGNCRKLPKIAENCRKLPKIAKNCQKLPKINENRQKSPKIDENRQKKIMKNDKIDQNRQNLRS